MDGKKQQLLFLTVDEIIALQVIARALIDTDGKFKRLAEVPISDQFKADLKSAVEKLDAKIEEL
jgi:hypothetical protein